MLFHYTRALACGRVSVRALLPRACAWVRGRLCGCMLNKHSGRASVDVCHGAKGVGCAGGVHIHNCSSLKALVANRNRLHVEVLFCREEANLKATA